MGRDCGDGFFGGSDEVGEEREGGGLEHPHQERAVLDVQTLFVALLFCNWQVR